MLHLQIFISTITGSTVMIPLLLLVCGVLYWNHKNKESYKIFFSGVTAMAITYTLKYITDIPRPYHMLVPETGSRFPSGHATLAAVVMSLGIYYAYTYVTNPVMRYLYYILAIAWFIIVGYSRLYLHVHYPVDIIAGGLIGVLGTLWVVQFFHHIHYYQD